MSLLIKNGILVTMNPHRAVYQGDLLIKEGRVAAIAGRIFEQADQIIDAEGMLVIPGLIQGHVHLCQALFRGLADDLELLDWLKQRIWPLEAAHDQESLYFSALLGCAELIRGGTTAIVDMGTVKHTESVFLAVEMAGLRYLGGKCLMDEGLDIPDGLRETVDAAIGESQDLIGRWSGAAGGRINYALCPRFVLSCSSLMLDQVKSLSQEYQLPVHTHASENRSEVEWVRRITGRDNIEYFLDMGLCNKSLILAHCVHLKAREMSILADNQVNVVHCPSANMKLASGFAPVPLLMDRGVPLSLGADGAPCNNTLNAFMEMRLAALIHKPAFGPQAMPAGRVFEMATLGGARAMGLEEQVGSLECGKKADLALISLQGWHHYPRDAASVYGHLVYQAAATDVFATIVEGRILMMDGRLTSLNEESLRQGVKSSLARIRLRTGI